MRDAEPIAWAPGPANAAPRSQSLLPVTFDRSELRSILSLYSRQVAAGEWRDYAIAFTRDVAVFAIHRRSSEHPLYRIEKRPKLRHRQGLYAIIAANGLVLKRGHDLERVLMILEKKRLALVD